MAGYTHEREHGIPAEFLEANLWPSENIQLALGVRWGLVVVDLDGMAGRDQWRAWVAEHGDVPTWTVATPRGGRHLWYRPPLGLGRVPSRELWRGDGDHEGVELLGCGRLAIAPPSHKVIDGEIRPYRFCRGRGPQEISEPAFLPPWVLTKAEQVVTVTTPPPRLPGPRRVVRVDGRFDRNAVLDALSPNEKLWHAVGWGLRIASSAPNAAGFHRAHAIDREDRRPSAGFHAESGYYFEPGKGLRLSLFDLGAALGAYATWQDACNDLGQSLHLSASCDFFS